MAVKGVLAVEKELPAHAADARPWPVGRVLAQARANRIEGDVPKGVLELIIGLDQSRAKSPLEEMPIEGVAVVESPRVSAVELVHSSRKRLFRCLDHQVKVIRHQAIAEVLPAAKVNDPVEQAEKQLAVKIVPVDGLAAVPARGDVERAPRRLESRWPRHDLRLRSLPA
jgi:hypothetical protein